jgi:serine/threonine-protein kinase
LAHYDLGAILGQGHCGFVFQATDRHTGAQVALKVLHDHFPKNEAEMQRFVRTLKAGIPLQHCNLVTVLGAGRSGSHCWIAQEEVVGETAAQVIQRQANVGVGHWHQAWRVAVHLARALQTAHQHGFIHRNITPANVLFRQDGQQWKLNDLLLSKALEGSLIRQISLRGRIQNELAYFAPEQTYPAPVIDIRTDLYSAGAVVYALLTGRPPLAGISMAETMAKIRQQEPTKPTEFEPFLPDEFEAILLKMLAKKPDDRFPSATELLAELDRLAGEVPE